MLATVRSLPFGKSWIRHGICAVFLTCSIFVNFSCSTHRACTCVAFCAIFFLTFCSDDNDTEFFRTVHGQFPSHFSPGCFFAALLSPPCRNCEFSIWFNFNWVFSCYGFLVVRQCVILSSRQRIHRVKVANLIFNLILIEFLFVILWRVSFFCWDA